MTPPLLSIKKIAKHYQSGKQTIKAVEDFSLEISRGEVVGLAGESGCGKTTIGKIIVRLITPTSGDLFYNGSCLLSMTGSTLRTMRQKIQIVLQDPYGSLNPRLTIEEIISEGLYIHKIAPGNLVSEALESVRLPASFKQRYPHELSGGQRQRVNIARALVLNPEFLILDESVSALDISNQRQIVELLKSLQKERGLTYLFISHDLSVLKALSDRICFMHQGKLVET